MVNYAREGVARAGDSRDHRYHSFRKLFMSSDAMKRQCLVFLTLAFLR